MEGRFLTLFVAAVSTCGCMQLATTNMSNPLVGGTLQQNKILLPDRKLESENGMQPGSLVQEASLTVLDAEKVCFDLVMQVDGAHVNLASPQAWTASMNGDPFFDETPPSFSEAKEHKHDVRAGETVARTASMQKICDENAEKCVTKTRVDAKAKSVNVNVSTGQGTVCFANKGRVTKKTRELTLTLQDPTSGSHNLVFRWQFGDAQSGATK
jgi:hypothetical protein